MKDLNAHLLRIITCIVFATFISCTSIFNGDMDDTIGSLEASNKVLNDSNVKIHVNIKSTNVPDSNKILTADSLLYANEDVNSLIDNFKEEIGNLALVGIGSEHARQVFASPYSFAALIYAVSNVEARTSVVMQDSPKKLTLDSILLTIKSMRTDSLWLKKHIEGAHTKGIILILSDLQMSCSNATNLALSELYNSDSKKYDR